MTARPARQPISPPPQEPLLLDAARIGDDAAPLHLPPRHPTAPRQSGDGQGGKPFRVSAGFSPSGDQPQAIRELAKSLDSGAADQVLLGVTGSGKTYTMAKLIERLQRPALVLAPNKTLAAQLYDEFKSFLPDNAVEYFVSYYDYYQPEAYVPRTDTYIDKESAVNENIDRLRHAATRAVLERHDVVIVASVSCIYGIGSPQTYAEMTLALECGKSFNQQALLKNLVQLHYKRNDHEFARGAFRVRGDQVDIFPAHLESRAWRVGFFGDEIAELAEFDPLTGKRAAKLDMVRIYPASHYVIPGPTLTQACQQIRDDLSVRLKELEAAGKLLEAQRLEQRTNFDLEMMEATGACAGVENYSRYLTGRKQGMAPPTLFEYLPENALLFVDESHVAVPQLGGMFKGDFRRKYVLAEHGFRLPACIDNRPLKFQEWQALRPQTIYVSATPGKFELEAAKGVFVEQIIRPTGLVDPEVILRPVASQVDDLLAEAKEAAAKNQRVLVTVLTKKMAEDLTDYLYEQGVRVRYMHSDIDTLERIEIVRDLRLGAFDVLVGINLLREGLDIPECALVAILDADKEGYLRSETSLIQTIGRAARHLEGRVILYADKQTGSIRRAIDETERRRKKQMDYNRRHKITPTSIRKKVGESLQAARPDPAPKLRAGDNAVKEIAALRREMHQHAAELRFEEAAALRDKIKEISWQDLASRSDALTTGLPASSGGRPGTRTRKAKAKRF